MSYSFLVGLSDTVDAANEHSTAEQQNHSTESAYEPQNYDHAARSNVLKLDRKHLN